MKCREVTFPKCGGDFETLSGKKTVVKTPLPLATGRGRLVELPGSPTAAQPQRGPTPTAPRRAVPPFDSLCLIKRRRPATRAGRGRLVELPGSPYCGTAAAGAHSITLLHYTSRALPSKLRRAR